MPFTASAASSAKPVRSVNSEGEGSMGSNVSIFWNFFAIYSLGAIPAYFSSGDSLAIDITRSIT